MRSIASEVGIRFGTVHSILTDILSMSKVSARLMPQMLTDDQKWTQHDIFPGFFCLAMKMIPAILSSEL